MKKILLLEKNPLVMLCMKKILHDHGSFFYHFSGEEMTLGPFQEWDIDAVIADEKTVKEFYPDLIPALKLFSTVIMTTEGLSDLPHSKIIKKPFSPQEMIQIFKELKFI